jgi:NAD+ diphosphatase
MTTVTTVDSALTYNGLTLDRAPARRADPDWIAHQRTRTGTHVIPFWQDNLLIGADPQPDSETVFLGLDGDTAVFATDLPEPAGQPRDLRGLVSSLDPAEAATLAYARGILHWSRNQRFCGACGAQTEPRDGGHVRACQGCGKLLFPASNPP